MGVEAPKVHVHMAVSRGEFRRIDGWQKIAAVLNQHTSVVA